MQSKTSQSYARSSSDIPAIETPTRLFRYAKATSGTTFTTLPRTEASCYGLHPRADFLSGNFKQ